MSDNKRIIGISVDECKKHCEKETEFKCATIDYDKTKSYCFLSELTHEEAKEKFLLRTSSQYDIYECFSKPISTGKMNI